MRRKTATAAEKMDSAISNCMSHNESMNNIFFVCESWPWPWSWSWSSPAAAAGPSLSCWSAVSRRAFFNQLFNNVSLLLCCWTFFRLKSIKHSKQLIIPFLPSFLR
jgi:hypothetical protein